MKSYARIRILSLAGDVLDEVTCIEPGEVAAFVDEIAIELGTLLAVRTDVARAMLTYDLADAVRVPMPECFALSDQTRRAFARDLAASIRIYFAPATTDQGDAS